ncbi:MAG: hypothetical protein AVDCRST_MAG66-2557, partial [uncultured Pseudonocardia sp.]
EVDDALQLARASTADRTARSYAPPGTSTVRHDSRPHVHGEPPSGPAQDRLGLGRNCSTM